MKTSLVLVSILALGACGGDDGGKGGGDTGGVPGSTLIKDLTPAQTDALCHAEAARTPHETITCSDGSPTDRGVDDAECTNADPIAVSDTCTATVNQLEACFDDIDKLSDEQLCDESSDNIPASCSFLITCSDGGSDDGSGAKIATAHIWARAFGLSR